MPLLLIVDDDTTARKAAIYTLDQLGYQTDEACDGKEALNRLANGALPPVNLVLLDVVMPRMDGKETLIRLRALYPHLPVIMLTGSTEIDEAVALMRLGASDFITKPFAKERLQLSIEQHLTIRTLENEITRLKREAGICADFSDLIGAQTGLAACVALGRKAAKSDIPVLITGESGVGKELFARALHGQSPRAGRNFIAVNCGAIPENLIESILFGHEKGSFTGAISRELGKFREAEGGTLLLDEIGELPLNAQTRLLRALQQKEVEPVGASRPLPFNVRIVCATHRNLQENVAHGSFREDLYYRLSALPIDIPPLRERCDDIPEIARHILAHFCKTERKALPELCADALCWLQMQPWNGNVRELENLLHRAVVLLDTLKLTEEDLAALTTVLPGAHFNRDYLALIDSAGQPKSWDQIETEVIAATLKRCGGQVQDAAKYLGMGQSTLYKKCATAGIR